MNDTAILWVVATPIGNLGDLSPRAAEVLAAVDLIAAEDTRHTARLLAHVGIDAPLLSLHEHNGAVRVERILQHLMRGASVALVSNAGTPLISDPGYELVRRVRAHDVPVHGVPGPCAAIAALSIAGMPTDRFVFEGFLPRRSAARQQRLAELSAQTRTLVLYESSHRIEAMLADLASAFGHDRQMVLARELTKLHEQTVQGSVAELATWLAADANRRRGEFVVIVAGATPSCHDDAGRIDLDGLLAELLALAGTRDAVKAAVRLTGLPRNQVYARALALQ